MFPEVESLATRMKGLALCGEDLFYSFFRYLLQCPRRPRMARELPIVLMTAEISVEE